MHKQKTTCVVIHCNFIPYNGLVTRLKKYQGPFRGSIILLGMYFWPGCYNWSIIYVEKERNIWLLLFWFVKLLKKIGTRAKSPRPCFRSSISEQIYWGASVSKTKTSWFCKTVIKFNFLGKIRQKTGFF